MKDKLKMYIRIFTETFRLSMFTVGGGYVIIGLMKKRFVDRLGWITEDEMLDYVSLAQSCPGVIAVNASVLAGYRLGGMWGVVFSTFGTVLPPLIVISVIAAFYNAFSSNTVVQNLLHGMQAGVAALMADVVISSCARVFKGKNVWSVLIMLASFSAVMFLNINAVWVILVGGAAGVAVYSITEYRKKNSGAELKR